MRFVIFALVPLILSIGVTPVLSFDFIPEADALKSKGNPLLKYGSATKGIVCDDRLCSEISNEVKPSHGIDSISTQDLRIITEKAFIYAYPMIENFRLMYGNMVDESSDEFLGSYNTLHDEEKLATPDDKGFVSPNVDTLYTYVWFDLRAEPMVVTLPPIEEDRYYTFQNVDYFSNNYFYMGTATTGNDGGTFLIAGPNWNGIIPSGIDGFTQSVTEFNYVLERNQVKNSEDIANANSIQKQFKIQSLSEFVGTAKPDSLPKIDFIPWDSEQGYSGDFVNYFNLILTWSEIPESEKSLSEEFSKIGIKPGETVDWDTVDPQIKNAMDKGVKTGFDKINDNIPNIGMTVGDWLILDAFGDVKYHKDDFLRRASGVMIGQYGNNMQEAIYPASFGVDGIPFDGQKNTYEITFASEPPVGAFWSLTVYDSETQFLIDNPIDRYLINSSSDIQKNDDGSFVLYLQQESPEDEKQSNWLPINDGSFYMGLRLYLPDESISNGLWKYPIIETIPK